MKTQQPFSNSAKIQHTKQELFQYYINFFVCFSHNLPAPKQTQVAFKKHCKPAAQSEISVQLCSSYLLVHD